MIELSLAYALAAAVIGGLLVLARRNRQEGWRRHRETWLEAQSSAAIAAFAAPSDSPPEQPDLRHLGDLDRLHQSLVAHNEHQSPAPVEEKDLTRSR
jgi:hypothetical protein